MKAVNVATPGGIEVLQLVDIDKPVPGPNDVLVKIAFAGVNFIDTYQRSGLYKTPMPFTPGREASGIVDSIGDQVTKFAVGDAVVMLAEKTYAQFALINESRVHKLPPGVSLELAASILLQGSTAIALAKYAYPVAAGEHVLVHAAAGGTGHLLAQIAELEGAIVIGTTSTEAKAEKLKALGFPKHVIVNSGHDFQTEVLRLTSGQGAHVVYDGVGRATFQKSLASVRKSGSLVMYGNASGPVPDINLNCLVPRNVRLSRASLFEFMQTSEEYNRIIDLLFQYISSNKLKVMPATIYPLDKVADAHRDIESGKTTGKLLLRVD